MNTRPSLNTLLKLKRQERYLDLPQIEKDIRISRSHLRALEEKNFDELPADIYTKNFIRSYAIYLEIYDIKSIEQFIEEFTLFHKQKQENEKIKNSMHGDGKHVIDLPKIFKVAAISSILIVSLVYLGLGVQKIYKPPFLEVTEPSQNVITQMNTINIQGRTTPEARVTINDSIILGDGIGNFSKVIDLLPGMNLIEVTASTKHGQTTTITRQILLEHMTSQDETQKEITRK